MYVCMFSKSGMKDSTLLWKDTFWEHDVICIHIDALKPLPIHVCIDVVNSIEVDEAKDGQFNVHFIL